METKQYVTLEVKKGDFTFTFNMPTGCTWGNATDAAFEVLQHIQMLTKNAVDQAMPKLIESAETQESSESE